jgi:hypothetical protein
MKKSSKADIKENSDRYSGCTFLEPREWLDGAIIGKCVMTSGLIYDYEEVVAVFMYKDGLTQKQAEEMVEFNMEKSIKRMPDPKPILQKNELTDEDYMPEPDFDWD